MPKKYSHNRIRYVYNVNDINKIIDISKQCTEIRYGKWNNKETMRAYTHIEDKQKYIEVTTQYVCEDEEMNYSLPKGKYYPCTWRFDKTGEENYAVSPSKVMRLANNVYKPYDIVRERPDLWSIGEDGRLVETSGAIVGYNEKYDNTEHEVYIYDLNSAYASVLMDKIIDTYHFRENDYVGENEVGFYISCGRIITIKKRSLICDFVFPLIDSPFKDFVKKYYDIKKTAPKGSKERQEAKNILNIMVGLWQHSNPLLRAYVVNECNAKIQSLMDENTCYYNTDAIYSIKERTDLNIGNEIGQFKLEYHGLFRQKKNNYQKVDINETSVRGVVKQAFRNNPNWNLLKDAMPYNDLKYKFNATTCKVEINDKYIGE